MFRAAVKACTGRAEEEPVSQRRRRSGDTGRAFCGAGRALLRRIVQLPPQAFIAAAYLSDTLDWLNLWHVDADTSSSEACDNIDASRNDLSLRL